MFIPLTPDTPDPLDLIQLNVDWIERRVSSELSQAEARELRARLMVEKRELEKVVGGQARP